MSYTITLTRRESIAANTMAFYFTKPQDFNYKAGQYADFTLLHPLETDAEGNKRTFSLASAPFETELMIATRMRDTAFKRSLRDMPLGGELTLEGSFGSFSLSGDPQKPAVILTGGIGVTFARSMIAQATKQQSPQKVFLFYSNHTPADAAFLDEFKNLAQQNPHFVFVPTMTDDPEWTGETGAISLDLLQKYVGDVNLPTYYLAGPSALVGAMRKLLLEANVNKVNIRADQFVGYESLTV